MKRLIMQMISAVLVSVLAFSLPMNAAADHINMGQEEVKLIDKAQEQVDAASELISLYRNAVKIGDTDAAARYEAYLAQLDVVHVDENDIVEHLAADGISLFHSGESTDNGLPSVSDTANVDWHIQDMKRYYYPEVAEEYDVYVIYATPKNDSSKLRKIVETESQPDIMSIFTSNAGSWASQEIISYFVEEASEYVPGVKVIYTIWDLISSLTSDVTPQEVECISIHDWTMLSVLDSTFTYIYIKESDTLADYELAMMGSKVDYDYVFSYIATVDLGNGYEDSYPTSKSAYNLSISSPNYGKIKTAIDYWCTYSSYTTNIIYTISETLLGDSNNPITITLIPSTFKYYPHLVESISNNMQQ